MSSIFNRQLCAFSLFIICTLTPFAKPLGATEILVSRLENDSIPSEYVSHIEQLSSGHLLFSTQSGARLYDGKRFLSLYDGTRQDVSPLEGYIYHTLEDNNHNIWFATDRGLFKLNKDDFELEKLESSKNNESKLINNNVRKILEDSEKNLWFGTLNGISRYSPTRDKFTNFSTVESSISDDKLLGRIFLMLEHQNKIWIGSSKGLFTIDKTELKLQRFPGKLGKSYVTSGFVNSSNEIWFGTDIEGIFQLDTSSGLVRQIKKKSDSEIDLRSNNIWALYKTPQERVWIGYWSSGVTVHDLDTQLNYHVKHRLNDFSSLPSSSIEMFVQDNSGLIWIATSGGIAHFNPANFSFSSTRYIAGETNSIPEEGIISAEKDGFDNIWIGSTKGLDKWNPKDGSVTHFYNLKHSEESAAQVAVWRILDLGNGKLLLATEKGLIAFEMNTGKVNAISNVLDINNKPVNYAFYALKKASDGNIYAASSLSTVHRINIEKFSAELVFDARQSELTADSEYYASIAIDKFNNMWLGSTTGLHRINLANGKIKVFNAGESASNITSNVINDLEIIGDTLWVATSNGGINLIDLETNRISKITEKDGLPANTVINLFSLDNKDIWFTSKDKVGEIDVESKTVLLNPLLSSIGVEFYEAGSSDTNKNNVTLVGTRVISFSPDKIEPIEFKAPVRISTFSRLHKNDPSFNPLSNTQSVTLFPEDTLVSFEFASLDFSYAQLARYRYKLEGYDSDWLYSGKMASATYTGLPPGSYRLQVQSTDRFGRWYTNNNSLKVNVIPAWWQSNLAYSLYLIALLLVLSLIVRRKRSERKKEIQTLNAIRQSESRMKDVLWGSGDEMWRWNLTTNEVYSIAKVHPDEKSVERIQFLEDLRNQIHPDDKSELEDKMARHLRGETSHFEAQYRIMDEQSHKWRWVLSRGRIVERLGNNAPSMVAGTTKDIDELKRTERQLRYLANYDQLTNLPNRSLFLEHLNHSISLAGRFEEKIALLFLDLDSFKMINDTLGHSVGDQLLQSVAQRLLRVLRGTDNLARLSGDEFAIIIERIHDAEEVEPTVNRLVRELSKPFELATQSVTTSLSVGIAMYPEDGRSPSQLLKHADIAMYQAKKNGKKQYQFFHPDMNALLEKRIDMEQELKVAIEQKQFEAFFQARACVETNKVKGFETLIRWFHPEKGMVSPAEFIPVAEETGQILEIGEIILEKACIQASTWYQQGWRGIVSVNIAALQFQQSDLVTTVRKTLEESKLPAENLELEITEGTLIKNIEHTRSLLLRLKEIGVKIALDDFGTGYSSLSYLQQLPIDVLKIDRSFILEITHSQKAAQLSKAIINMAHSLGLSVVAEGIEEETQLAFLKNSGCEEYQGFLFGRPVPAEELLF